MSLFTHLHVHTQYSILDGMSSIPALVDKCLRDGMNALAITDHGTMFGIKEFYDYVSKKNDKQRDVIKEVEKELSELEQSENPDSEALEACKKRLAEEKAKIFKPIFGCEAYVARQTPSNPNGSRLVRENIENRSGYHLVLLAKNEQGYHNLCKMISASWIDGRYYRPRIDRELLAKYHEGIIVSSACLAGELPRALYEGNYDKAKEALLWYKNLFGDDFYLELQRHKTDKPGGDTHVYEQQKVVNEELLRLAKETDTKIIATNDVHFVEEEHGEAHDRLICLSTGKTIDDPNRLHYTKQEWLKSPEEMAEVFSDLPEALSNTQEIVGKVEFYKLKHAPIMPVFNIPESFGTVESYRQRFSEEDLRAEFESGEDGKGRVDKLGGIDRVYRIKLEADYLRKLTLEGAVNRYGDPIPEDVMERIDFELQVMRNMGFPGYFLIVQDFIAAARNMGVSVGPGRGSAAGSVVAYCLKITDIDPLKYDLLFERFLNPDRISLPDIDVDFDDDGRYKILDWITEKYGSDRVAHIITYGTMATKSSIKDVARVQNLPLSEANLLASYVPQRFPEDPKTHKAPKVNLKNCLSMVPDMKNAYEQNPDIRNVLTYASQLEGTVRQVGIHACGVIIGADDLTKFVPLSTVEDKETQKDVVVTQYEGSVIEDVGLIKMDFLGLRTLSIIKDTLENIRKSKAVDIDIDHIPIDDPETYQLFCEGATVAIFQFESPGMQKYLKELHPEKFEDLIAMNALYRPGPMDYIPQFINRKQGREKIEYDIPVMEKYLKETYGITVYQEQVMLLSRLLANFSRGESDTLRKAMGKKQREKLDHMKPDFIERGKANGHNPIVLEKIWADWEKFASYAFNKSHATCYSWVAYQTAYLKAHYPAEFMAANLTHNQNNISEVSILMTECKRLGIPVLGPDINESDLRFTVNTNGEIRYGLAALKGVGGIAAESIITERKENGVYQSVMDFLKRVNLRSCNKKCVESLGLVGSFDSLEDLQREHFKDTEFLDRIIRMAARFQEQKQSSQISLFGDEIEVVEDSGIDIPQVIPWTHLYRLKVEADICGNYVSGFPLDKYGLEIKHYTSSTLNKVKKIAERKPGKSYTQNCSVAGMVISSEEFFYKNGRPYRKVVLQDSEDDCTFFVKGEVLEKNAHLFNLESMVIFNLKPETYTRKDGTENFSWAVTGGELLDYVMENKTKKIKIFLTQSMVDDKFIGEFKDLVKKCKENASSIGVEFSISDPIRMLNVTLEGVFKVDVFSFCHQFVEQYPGINVQLIS